MMDRPGPLVAVVHVSFVPNGLHNAEVLNFWVVGASVLGSLSAGIYDEATRRLLMAPLFLEMVSWYHLMYLHLFWKFGICMNLPSLQSCVHVSS